jgi:hypothetical protein
MNPGITEEVGKAAGGVIDAMKSQPLALALVIMNCALLGLFFYVTSTIAKQREREVALMYADQKEIRELVSRCMVPHKETAS